MSGDYHTRQTLLGKIRNRHDQGAWQEFSSFYKAYIYQVIANMGVAKDDVEDVRQRVLVVLWKKLPEFDYQPDKCKFRTWMNQVTRFEVLKYFKTSSRQKNLLERVNELDVQDEFNVPDIEEIAEKEWELHISNLAWSNIKDDFKGHAEECFQLFNEGWTANKIAEKLELELNTVYVLRQRVVKKLCIEIRRLDQELS